MGDKPLTLLLSPLGTPATCGVLHMLRQNPEAHPVRIVGTDLSPARAEGYLIDRYCALPPFVEPAFGEQLVTLCRDEGVDFLLAQTEPAAFEMARWRGELEAVGATPLVASLESLQRAADKARLLTWLKDAGVEVPDFAVVQGADALCKGATELGYPERDLIVKPTNWRGSRGVYRLTARVLPAEELFGGRGPVPLRLERVAESLSSTSPRLLLMEYLPGDEYSVDAFIGARHEVAIPRRRCRRSGGTAVDTVLEHEPLLVEHALQSARALELTQLCGFQYKRDARGRAKLLECNPRIQSNLVASLFSGVNLAWLAVGEALGIQTKLPPLRAPVTVQRTFGGVAFASEWHEVF